jgi:hypothetical protein
VHDALAGHVEDLRSVHRQGDAGLANTSTRQVLAEIVCRWRVLGGSRGWRHGMGCGDLLSVNP